jgi:hypothetical protein
VKLLQHPAVAYLILVRCTAVELLIKAFLLAAVIRLLIATNKPLLCAGIYAGSAFVLGAVSSGDIMRVTVMAGLAFIAAFIYFWILDRIESLLIWWVVAVVGASLVLL